MSEPARTPGKLVALRLQHKNAYDAVAMLAYLILVYIWGLWIYPLGRDFHHLAVAGAEMPNLARQLFALEVQAFGANPVGYHLVNCLLMYACMLLIFHFVNNAAKGLWWFGTFAACVFMSNPVHSESMHNLSGVADLVPCLAALVVLNAVVLAAHTGGAVRYALAVAAMGAHIVFFREDFVVLIAAILYPVAVKARFNKAYVFVLVLAPAILGLGLVLAGVVTFPTFASSYLVVYPIGFLPETLAAYHANTAYAWGAAVGAVLVAWLIHRKVQRPLFLYALVSMVLTAAMTRANPVDWVHMVGGGRLLVANAFFVLALVIVIFRIMDNPKWRLPMISLTTMFVVIFFAMQWRSMRAWHDAGVQVKSFQVEALRASESVGGTPIGVLPDYQFRLGAPVCLSDAIRFDTPFSEAVPHVSLLPLHGNADGEQTLAIRAWSDTGGSVVLTSPAKANPFRFFPHAPFLADGEEFVLPPAVAGHSPDVRVRLTEQTPDHITVEILGEGLPTVLVPRDLSGKETNSQAEPDADNQ